MEKDKRYLLFTYSNYYPLGGLCDMSNSFDTEAEAIKYARESVDDYQEIYDRIEGIEINFERL